MAKEKRKFVFNIAVIGLSGTEQVKGTSGVGKSCLCNRFIREEADNYYPDHTSVLSQSDFGGRVVNNDHFLYWGEATKQDDSGQDYKFHVIEQTEFIDDQSYQPHRSSSNQIYAKRCCQTKVTSAEKLMYICTDQLGIESDFESKLMPDGKLNIDGFMLCFDVSNVTNRTIDHQVRFVQNCYHYLVKTKKPVLVALTKCDEADSNGKGMDGAAKFAVGAGGKRGAGLPIVETSASENINVTSAFLILAQLIDKSRSKSKISSFKVAAQERKELLKDAKVKLQKLMESTVTNYQESWQSARKQIESETAYLHFVDLEGKNAASNIFRKHVNGLRDDYRQRLQSDYLRFFPRALKITLPDVSSLRATWSETLTVIMKSDQFDRWVVSMSELNLNGLPWFESRHMTSLDDRRIPSELLLTAEAEHMYVLHRKALEAKQRKEETKAKFKHLLQNSAQVTPGREWADLGREFKQCDFLTELNDGEISSLYDQYQMEIKEKARLDFQELLYEKYEIFVNPDSSFQADIDESLKEDPRYTAMARMERERGEILARHVDQVLNPPPDNWGAECLHEALKSCPRSRDDVIVNDVSELNVVLLGADGLPGELANQITVRSLDGEGAYELDGHKHQLRLRRIDGNVQLPANSFKTSSFHPHGCVAVYSSLFTLRYIEKSLEKTVLSTPADGDAPFQGLPVSILFANFSEKEVDDLKEAGERLASRVGCPLISPPDHASAATPNRRFHDRQVNDALRSLIGAIRHRRLADPVGADPIADQRKASLSSSASDRESPQPDLRVVMCTRINESPTAEVALAPLLAHASYHPPAAPDTDTDPTECSVTIETYLGMKRRRIEVVLASYQAARSLLEDKDPVHGFILVFDTLKRSSFALMKVFATNAVSAFPLLLLCVSPADDRPSAACFFQQDTLARQLVVEGNTLADRLGAKFVSASARHRTQTEVYSTFFRDAWDHKDDTEAIYRLNRVVMEDDGHSSHDEMSCVQPHPPVPAPRTKKASSMENLASEPMCEIRPRSGRVSAITPPSTLRMNVSLPTPPPDLATPVGPPGGEQKGKDGQDTPASTWSGSDEYRPSTPRTSPTAGLIDNEMNPAYCDAPSPPPQAGSGEPPPPPTISSHLYPSTNGTGPAQGKVLVDNNHSATQQHPGKLDPSLVSKVAAGLKKPPPPARPTVLNNHHRSTSPPTDHHPGDHVPSRIGTRVLPPPSILPLRSEFQPAALLENGMTTPTNTPTDPTANQMIKAFSRTAPFGGSMHGSSRRPGVMGRGAEPASAGKRRLHKSVDMVTTPSALYDVGGTSRLPPRQSESDTLSSSFSGGKSPEECPMNTPNSVTSVCGGGMSRTRDAKTSASHEDLTGVGSRVLSRVMDPLRPSHRAPIDHHRFTLTTPKEDKRHKIKDEEKRRYKEEKKGKEKEQRSRLKPKNPHSRTQLTAQLPGPMSTGNKHNLSDYFNRCLDDIIQGLNHMVPLFVEKCVRFVEAHGLTTEGLYRISANSKEREAHIRKFDEDNSYEFEATEASIATVAGCLTWFFSHKNLPEPLIPYSLHDELEYVMNTMPPSSMRNLSVRGVIRKLPYSNYATFKFLCTHLKRVSEKESLNKMPADNLAICWWPTLFRPDVDSSSATHNNSAATVMTKTCFRDVLHTCIVQCPFIFYGQSEL